MSVPELHDLERSGIFEKICALYPSSSALSGGDKVERIELLGTSPNYFEVLGAAPALGRTYTQSEWVPGFLDAVVISLPGNCLPGSHCSPASSNPRSVRRAISRS